MRKKNTSDRKRLKTKYFEQKKRKARKVKLKRDIKKNPNNHHTKKADPGIPNICPFKKEILAERAVMLYQKETVQNRKKELVLKSRQKLKEAMVAGKRKLPSTITPNFILIEPNEYEYENKAEKKTKNNAGNMDESTAENKDVEMTDVNGTSGEITKTAAEIETQERKFEIKRQRRQAIQMKRDARTERKHWSRGFFETKNYLEKPVGDPRFTDWSEGQVHYSEVRKVVNASDVLLEVVDARDPLGTRCTILEKLIKETPGKKLVMVINKSDLIPRRNLEDWLKYFRIEVPTVAFKAATKRPKTFKKSIDRMLYIGEECARTPASMGGEMLIQLLKNYARSSQFGSLTVGVVGLPNVGKSSIINSLKKMKSCEVSAKPGSTKGMKYVKLDKKLSLVDSPGVVFPSKDMSQVEMVLKNVIDINRVHDPQGVAKEIYDRCDHMKLLVYYEIRQSDTCEEFLLKLARRSKKVMSNGLMDLSAAAKRLIYDWNHGFLKYYTEPPKRHTTDDVKTSVVSTMKEDFVTDPVLSTAEEIFLRNLPVCRPCNSMKTGGTQLVEDFSHLGVFVPPPHIKKSTQNREEQSNGDVAPVADNNGEGVMDGEAESKSDVEEDNDDNEAESKSDAEEDNNDDEAELDSDDEELNSNDEAVDDSDDEANMNSDVEE